MLSLPVQVLAHERARTRGSNWWETSFRAPAPSMRLTITGAAGYLGSEMCWQAVNMGHDVRAVMRDADQASPFQQLCCEIYEADLTDSVQAREAAEGADAVIHTASIFRLVADMEQDLVRPNIALAEEMVCACAAANARLVFTSSMAAVRGNEQPLPPGRAWYTTADWNWKSTRDGPSFSPYQWSKMASEKRAWELAREVGLEMVSLCPSMILGPPRDAASSAFSVQLVRGWLEGRTPIKPLLVCDVRDVARAHLAAATLPDAAGRRYVVSRERRVPATELAAAIRERVGAAAVPAMRIEEASADSSATAVIPVGQREVDADALEELGVRCRPDKETVADMAELLVPLESAVAQ